MILDYQPGSACEPKEEWLDRQALTLELAAEFFAEHSSRHCRFTPMGAAQGWSPSLMPPRCSAYRRSDTRASRWGGWCR